MCGITGWLNWNKNPCVSLISEMNNSLIHRGPDAGSVRSFGPVVLGHRRLSIIDLSESANQPMTSTSGNLNIVFNGEIYNYLELRKELEKYGARFRTRSDTEVILEAYQHWGVECISKFNGMFCFVIWDKANQRLLMARDRIGEKPLFYANDGNGGLIFASELKAMRLHPAIRNKISNKAVGQYLSLNYVLGETCFLQDVKKLLPAHYLIYEKGGRPIIKSYWDLSLSFKNKVKYQNENEASFKLKEIIDDATKMRMVSDVPLGAFLSGGVDSATITSAMTRFGTSNLIKTFTVGFDEKTYSEADEAQFAASILNVDHNLEIINSDSILDLSKLVFYMDEPMADTSFIPLYYLSKFARKKVTVALSGDGGDEILGGYQTYIADKLHKMTSMIPSVLFNISNSFVNRFLPVSHAKVSFDFKIRQFLKGKKYNSDQAHYFWRTIYTDFDKESLLRPEYKKIIMEENPFMHFAMFFEHVNDCNYLDRAMYVDIKTWLPDDILVKLDRASMANSLECRAPFLDHRLVEFCASLPVDMKIRGFRTKHLLKQSQVNFLPSEILNRNKKGFNAPIANWITGRLKDQMIVASTGNVLSEYLDIRIINKLWQDHLTMKKDNSYKLFGLSCLGLWLENLSIKH